MKKVKRIIAGNGTKLFGTKNEIKAKAESEMHEFFLRIWEKRRQTIERRLEKIRLDDLELYFLLTDILMKKPISVAEEHKLFAKAAEGDEEARKTIIRANYYMVALVAFSIEWINVPPVELLRAGYGALCDEVFFNICKDDRVIPFNLRLFSSLNGMMAKYNMARTQNTIRPFTDLICPLSKTGEMTTSDRRSRYIKELVCNLHCDLKGLSEDAMLSVFYYLRKKEVLQETDTFEECFNKKFRIGYEDAPGQPPRDWFPIAMVKAFLEELGRRIGPGSLLRLDPSPVYKTVPDSIRIACTCTYQPFCENLIKAMMIWAGLWILF